MFIYKFAKREWRQRSLYFIFFLSIILSSAPYAISQVRQISFAEAEKMAEKAEKESSFPVLINESVLTQINYYLGTPDGRAYMRGALDRMTVYRDIIEKKLDQYGAPKALLAIPLVESGYRNLPQVKNGKSAGVWQFIESTANHYGLRVDDQVDERLDVASETDAAIRYLAANHLRFRDWGLALLAYNAGASRVQKGIDTTGSRDPWILIRAGFENNKDYLSKVTAALIIMYNPSMLAL